MVTPGQFFGHGNIFLLRVRQKRFELEQNQTSVQYKLSRFL